MRSPLLAALLLLALLPALFFAWRCRDVPQLGTHHDDALYLITARSLATDGSYRILSLPDQPFQTKYPPLYPLLLSLAWQGKAPLSAAAPRALWLTWLFLPLYLPLVWWAYRRLGLGDREAALLVLFTGASPFLVLFSTSLMAELPFAALALGAVLLAQRAQDEQRLSLACAAGLCAAAAYLTRSMGLALLASVPLCFALRRQWRLTAGFAAVMAPVCAAWQLWLASHQAAGPDATTLYYTSYLGDLRSNLHPADFAWQVWVNAAELLQSAAKVVLFNEDGGLGALFLTRLLGMGALLGCWRLWRAGHFPQLFAYAAATLLLLLVWVYPPGPRFVLALAPAFIAGLYSELRHFFAILRTTWTRRPQERPAAALIGLAAAALLGLALLAHLRGLTVDLPGLVQQQRTLRQQQAASLAWLRQHLPPDSRVAAYDDGVLWLHTGLRGATPPLPAWLSYGEGPARLDPVANSLPDFFRAQRITHIVLTGHDFSRSAGLRDDYLPKFRRVLDSLPAERLYTGPGGFEVRRILPAEAAR